LKVLIVGVEETLGEISKLFLEREYEVVAYKRSEYNLLRWDHVIMSMGRINPKITFLSQFVEDPFISLNPDVELTREVHDGVRNLAQGASRYDSKIVLISSEMVFDGKKPYPQPYFEEDRTAPNTKAGQVKLETEIAILENAMDFLIIRTGWMYHPFGQNFVKVILKKALAEKQPVMLPSNRYGSPTLSYRVAMQIKRLLDSDARGIYHVTSEGFCNLADCARFIFQCLNITAEVEEYDEDDTNPKEVLPGNWILENKNLKAEFINIMVPWEDDLKTFLQNYGPKLLQSIKNDMK